jgi:hypothetical protein
LNTSEFEEKFGIKYAIMMTAEKKLSLPLLNNVPITIAFHVNSLLLLCTLFLNWTQFWFRLNSVLPGPQMSKDFGLKKPKRFLGLNPDHPQAVLPGN